ncbi:hypothetical protein LY76DRAFT_589145 [Colletotrichum caudatum]|nr:hypothetical protein LY76DRAFT_589145 [Colletotrichum caudatum]
MPTNRVKASLPQWTTPGASSWTFLPAFGSRLSAVTGSPFTDPDLLYDENPSPRGKKSRC